MLLEKVVKGGKNDVNSGPPLSLPVDSAVFYSKTPKIVLLSNQILLRGRFVFKTSGGISSMTSYKDHGSGLFMS